MWGNLKIFITSYFRLYENPDLDIKVGGIVFPFMMLSMALGMPLGVNCIYMFKSIKWMFFFVINICCGCVFASSYVKNFWAFVVKYGIISEFVAGLMNMSPCYLCYLHIPKLERARRRMPIMGNL